MYNILVTSTNNIDEFMESQTFKKFNNQVIEYREKVEKEFYDILQNDQQKKIFLDWCKGICVSSEAYKKENNISEKDNYEAHSAIISVVSLGLG